MVKFKCDFLSEIRQLQPINRKEIKNICEDIFVFVQRRVFCMKRFCLLEKVRWFFCFDTCLSEKVRAKLRESATTLCLLSVVIYFHRHPEIEPSHHHHQWWAAKVIFSNSKQCWQKDRGFYIFEKASRLLERTYTMCQVSPKSQNILLIFTLSSCVNIFIAKVCVCEHLESIGNSCNVFSHCQYLNRTDKFK